MNAAVWLALKDLRLLARDRVALFWVLGFPLIFALFLGSVLRAGLRGEQAPIDVVLVSGGAETSRLLAGLRTETRLKLRTAERERASELVRRGEAVAYVQASQQGALLGIDPSRAVEAAFVREAISGILTAPPAGVTATPARPRIQTVSVSKHSEAGPRETAYVYPAAVLWGLIGCAACFAISMVTERTQGTFLRLSAAPIRRSAILSGKALACAMACLVVTAAISAIAIFAFGARFERPFAVAVTLLASIACFVGITMLLSLLGRTEQSVAGAGWAVLILMAMLGGGMVPLSFMPDWLLPLSNLSPAKWSILALEGATWRHFSYRELALPCSALVGTALVGFIAGAGLLARTRP